MNYETILLAELDRGFSKADLERLIGLPKNNLSGILKGDRNLSKKSQLKIDKWMASEKPDPLNVFFVKKDTKVADLNITTNEVKPKEPLGNKKTNYAINTANEPKENSMAFFSKYGCMTWAEVKAKK